MSLFSFIATGDNVGSFFSRYYFDFRTGILTSLKSPPSIQVQLNLSNVTLTIRTRRRTEYLLVSLCKSPIVVRLL